MMCLCALLKIKVEDHPRRVMHEGHDGVAAYVGKKMDQGEGPERKGRK